MIFLGILWPINRLIQSEPGSFLWNFMRVAPADRAHHLTESTDLDTMYRKAAFRGSSQPPDPELEVEYHYICLMKHSDHLFELDGDRMGPICRGRLEMDEDVLSEKGRKILEMYINSCPEGNFNLLALIKSS